MAKARATTAKIEKSALSLALDHAFIATGGPADYAEFCKFEPGWLIGYDGIIGAGCRVQEHLTLAPHTETFRAAVLRAGGPYSITAKPDGSVVVTGDKVRAVIQTFPLTRIPNVVPDAPMYGCNDAFRRVAIDVSKITPSRADTVIGSAVQLSKDSVTATDGGTILEGWHGLGLPLQAVIPREFCDAIAKVKYQPTHLGWSENTLTMWFGQEAWIRTNIYGNEYPDTEVIFARVKSRCNDFRPVPPEMLVGIDMLKPFRESAEMLVTDYGLNTRSDHNGASFTFPHHMPWRGMFPTEGLRAAAAHGQWIAFAQDCVFWYGPAIRGATSLKSDVF